MEEEVRLRGGRDEMRVEKRVTRMYFVNYEIVKKLTIEIENLNMQNWGLEG